MAATLVRKIALIPDWTVIKLHSNDNENEVIEQRNLNTFARKFNTVADLGLSVRSPNHEWGEGRISNFPKTLHEIETLLVPTSRSATCHENIVKKFWL